MGETGKTQRRRITVADYRLLLKCFIVDIPAVKAARIVGVNRKTADRYYNIFRGVIYEDAMRERNMVKLGNGIEIDESYFGPKRVRGKRGRGAGKKIVVFGILKRGSKVYTTIVPDAKKRSLMPIIRRVVQSGSDICSDGWGSYNALAIYGYNHKKVRHEKNEFSKRDGRTHINGVESYWSWMKRRLRQFNGFTKERFKYHILESEWRFNHRDSLEDDLSGLLQGVVSVS